MSRELRIQFERQVVRARLRSMDQREPVTVVLRKSPGRRAWISVWGSSISWGAVEVWTRCEGLRYRVLRVYQRGQEVPRPHRVGRLP